MFERNMEIDIECKSDRDKDKETKAKKQGDEMTGCMLLNTLLVRNKFSRVTEKCAVRPVEGEKEKLTL